MQKKIVKASPPSGALQDHRMRGLRLRTWRSCYVVPGGFGSRPYRAYFSDNPLFARYPPRDGLGHICK
jgi:hypothetical protein